MGPEHEGFDPGEDRERISGDFQPMYEKDEQDVAEEKGAAEEEQHEAA